MSEKDLAIMYDAAGNNIESYNAESITVLKGLDAVRKRPGMYIGDTDDGSGLHHMVYEAVDNSVDEALAGHASLIMVTINVDGSVTVQDNGRGIPTDIHKEEGISAAEVIMTQLHAGGKFDHNSYKVSGGLHGVGVSVVNALSSWLELTIWRGGAEYFVRFENGNAVAPLKKIKNAEGKQGTSITFFPSTNIFKTIEFNYKTLEHRLKELAFLNSGVNISIEDLRSVETLRADFQYTGGIYEFVKYLDKAKTAVSSVIVVQGIQDEIGVDVALEWNDSYHENIMCFTNNIRQNDGGTHLAGFKSALTRSVNNYIAINYAKKEKVNFSGEDAREGLTAIVSVKVPDPKFSSQTKDKLVSSEVRQAVETFTLEKLNLWFETNPQEAKLIINKAIEAANAREAARKARELIRKKTGLEIASISGKHAECQSNDPTICELFLVEGDSAAGSAKQGRERKNQAILSLKGKIMNVERARFDKILGSSEIGTIITALNTSIGKDDFNIEKLRYHKIIIMTDADVDGSHIRTLLLTFFYRYMPEIIEKGYLYIAQPPLYKVKKGSAEKYLKNDVELNEYLISSLAEVAKISCGDRIYDNDELKEILSHVINFHNQLLQASKKINLQVLEMLILSDVFAFENIADQNLTYKIANINETLHNYFIREKFVVSKNEDVLEIQHTIRGMKKDIILDDHFCKLMYNITIMLAQYKHIFQKNAHFVVKDQPALFNTPNELYNLIMLNSKKGITIQRFKGLGEMNYDQLAETTMNPKNRTLLQVKINDLTETDEIFSTLMGDVVEPRKEFIQSNALNATNIDV